MQCAAFFRAKTKMCSSIYIYFCSEAYFCIKKNLQKLTLIDYLIDVHCLKHNPVYALSFLPFSFLSSCIMQKP